MTIHHVTDATFNTELKKEGITLVNFWASWCVPCKIYAPILDAYAKENTEDVKKDGKPVEQEIGVLSSERLKVMVRAI